MTEKLRFKRVLLKVSGEALMGEKSYGHDFSVITHICNQIKTMYEMGAELCLVVGGGNIFRGISSSVTGMERASADYMGMLATVINALALQNALEMLNVPTRVLSAIPMMTVCEPYIRRRAMRHMEKKRVVIFAAGTGNPFFTTDTAATLRAIEMGCDALFKGTQVDGVYSSDPRLDKNATRYTHITYKEVLHQDLAFMDMSAITLARENNIPVLVFSLHAPEGFARVLRGEGLYTLITEERQHGG